MIAVINKAMPNAPWIALAPLALCFVTNTAGAADAGAPDAGHTDAGVEGGVVDVQWDKRTALIAGTSCVKGIDSFALVNGNDVAFVFSNLGVAIDGMTPEATVRETCSFKIQSQIGAGLYPSAVTQSYEYGIRKSAGASGSLEANIRLFGFNVTPLPLSFPVGAPLDVDTGVASRTDSFLKGTPWSAAWCRNGRATSGAFQGNLTVQGDRGGATDSIEMFVHGLGLKYNLHVNLEFCGI